MLSRGSAGPGYTVYDEDDLPAALPQAEAPPAAEAPLAAETPLATETPLGAQAPPAAEARLAVEARRRTLGRVAAGGLLAAAVVSVAGLALADALRGQHRRPAAVARENGAPYGVRDASRGAQAHRGFARRLPQPRRGIRDVALRMASRVSLPDIPAARARAGSILAAPSPPAQPRQSEFGFER